MSISKRNTSNPPSQSDLKQRVITCINKLSDRDTVGVATTELNSIAKTLTPDNYSPFLTCIYTTDSSEKSPVRTQCVRLLGLLSASHGDSLSPHLSKMLSAVIRRLRDPDSAVRAACIDAVSSMASQITSPPFSALSKPLIDAILHEQDNNVQIGSALCLSAAIEAAPDPEPAQLVKLLPKLVKLMKNDCFKAKAAMLTLIGSVISAGGAKHRGLVNCLVNCLVECLSSDDWAARKAAAEGLLRLGMIEREMCVLSECKGSCLASLETRRFDKVKVVRETMTRAFQLWKEIAADEVSELIQMPKDCGSGIQSPANKGTSEIGFVTPKPKKSILTSRLPPSDSSSATNQKSIPLKASARKQKLDFKKTSGLKSEIDVPQPFLNVTREDDNKITNSSLLGSADNGTCGNPKQEEKPVLFNKSCDEKSKRTGGLRSRSRVVPLIENDGCKINVAVDSASEDIYWNHKEAEGLSLIQKQLLQIENQQSSLLDLLQRYIGSSQSGMTSLETRVNGIEMALDEISQNLAVSSGSVSDTDSAVNTCCMLPRAEFLSPKFWRRTEELYPTSRVSFRGINHFQAASSNSGVKDVNSRLLEVDFLKARQLNGNRYAVSTAGGNFRGSQGC